jgi:hypothetical protein
LENYFNYFTEIEEYFWKKRGTALLVSTLDWALIDTWKQAQIPLEVVLQGIDQAFEKYQKRPRRSQKINSLAYCHQAVLAAAERAERAHLPLPTSGDPIPRPALVTYLTNNAEKLERAAESFRVQGRPESAATFQAMAASLRELAEEGGSDAPLDLEAVERRLTVLEDRMLSILRNAAPEAEMVALRAELDRTLGPARRNLGSEQVALLERQFLTRKLLEQADLPRLSLFYL